MSSERTNKKRLDDIEGQLNGVKEEFVGVKEELGTIKKQVTNDIPHALKDLKEGNESLFTLINENAKINTDTHNAAMRIVEIMAPYTHFRDTDCKK